MRPHVILKFCVRCRMAVKACYCASIRPFRSGPMIAVLVHPKENRKRIGTNRIVQLGIENSLRFQGTGEELDADPGIESLFNNPALFPTVLFPGPKSIDLDRLERKSLETASLLAPEGKRLLVFVIDGTWDQAKQMLYRSPKLRALPQIMFQPEKPSTYRIRKQPGAVCLSTVEAVHTLLEKLDRLGLYSLPSTPPSLGERPHRRSPRRFQANGGFANPLRRVSRFCTAAAVNRTCPKGQHAPSSSKS